MRIAGNRFSGDLHRYRITASVDEIDVDVTLVGQVPPWRQGTGYMLYGPKRDLEVRLAARRAAGHRDCEPAAKPAPTR